MAKFKALLLSIGCNLKLGKKIGIFNLPQGDTCPGKTELCARICYACKAARCYKEAREMRARNLERSQRDTFVQDMIAEIKGTGITRMRWHESGDVYSAAYAAKIIAVVRACPDVQFLIYTKSFMFRDILLDKPDNLSVYWSIDRTTHGDVPNGNTARLLLRTEAVVPGEATCVHSADKHYCGEECKICWYGKVSVYFPQH